MYSHTGRFSFDAQLVIPAQVRTEPAPGTWYISHQLGGPARGTYTEVAFVTDGLPSADHLPYEEEIVRTVAGELYGPKYAFIYPSAEAAGVEQFRMKRRERVVITDILTLEV